MTDETAASIWPLFGLSVVTPRLVLRYADDEDLQKLARFRRGGVISAGEEPFDGDATFYMDSPRAERTALTNQWGARSRTTADWWYLCFAAVVDGEVVGEQGISGADFPRVRVVESFSFLAKSHRGRGLGKEMRSAVLHLAFAGLGAVRAESEAFADNDASLGVSRSLRYEPNGTKVVLRPSGPAVMVRNVLTKDRWASMRREDLQVDGLDPCLAFLGLKQP